LRKQTPILISSRLTGITSQSDKGEKGEDAEFNVKLTRTSTKELGKGLVQNSYKENK
jgi:hypothetical protein